MPASLSDFLKTNVFDPQGSGVIWSEAFWIITLRCFLALVGGWIVTRIYRSTYANRQVPQGYVSTLILLSVLTAVITQVIGDNIARAFSLVGALAVVRFRSIVHDTLDIAFVLFAVIIGMATGAGHYEVAVIGLFTGAIAVLAQKRKGVPEPSDGEQWVLDIKTLPEVCPETSFLNLIVASSNSCALKSITTKKQGQFMQYSYQLNTVGHESPTLLIQELSKMSEVHNIELRMLGD